jgi:hypothetical protein
MLAETTVGREQLCKHATAQQPSRHCRNRHSRNNRRAVESGDFCAVCTEAIQNEEQLSSFAEEEAPFRNTYMFRREKIFVMDIEETEARNDCAGEGQQKFSRSTDRPTLSVSQ